MPLVPVAECHTAADVWRVARAAAARRRLDRMPRAAKPVPPAPPPPAPEPEPPVEQPVVVTRPLSHRLIRQVVADAYGLPVDAITGPGHPAAHVQVRSVSMLLCRILLKSSQPKIGYWHGGRDHTTVMHALRKLSSIREQLEARLTNKNHIAEWAALAVELWPPIVMKR